jgi:hypothetical protein
MPMSVPDASLGAAEIVTTWLPEAFAAIGSAAPAGSPVLRLTLSGPGGGDFRLDALGAALSATNWAGDDGDAECWLRQTAADFVAVFRGDPDLPALLPANWTVADMLFLDPRDLELVRQVAGRVRFEITGRRRRRWAIDAALGREGLLAGRARSTVSVEGATFERLAVGSIPPVQALMEGKIKIDGDRTLAMKLLMLIGARLGRAR